MSEQLFIRLAREPAVPDWVVVDATGSLVVRRQSGSLAEASTAAAGRRVVLLAPGPDVVLTRVQLPAANPARLRQMLPFSLEDQLADDIDDLAFAVGARVPAGTAVAVVASERLSGWLAESRAANLEPSAVFSAAEGVPATPGALTLLLCGAQILGRRNGDTPFVFDGLGLRAVLELVSQPEHAGQNAPTTAASRDAASGAAAGAATLAAAVEPLVIYLDEEAAALHAADLATLRASRSQAEVKLLADGPLPQLAATLAHQPGTNLLQGRYAPKSNWAALVKPWRVAASMAAASALLAVLLQGVSYLGLVRDDVRLNALVEQGCARIVGADGLAACEAEVQRRLRDVGKSGTSSETFLTTLAAVAEMRGPAMRLEALSYRNRELSLSIGAPTVPALDKFASDLTDTRRFEARIEAANQRDSGYEGRVQIVAVQR